MTITLLFNVPPSSLSPLPSSSSSSSSQARSYKYNNSSSCQALTYPSRNLFVSHCSPPSTSIPSPVVDEEDLPSPDELPVPDQSEYAAAAIQSGVGCKACGRQEIEEGCNGEGRIQGGIATVPGFGWWPIKAYRPCPGFVASGGRYRRQGQSMDEVAFGRGPTPSDSNPSTSSKKQGPKKSKK